MVFVSQSATSASSYEEEALGDAACWSVCVCVCVLRILWKVFAGFIAGGSLRFEDVVGHHNMNIFFLFEA